jgi:hypothetical protein
MKRKTTLWLTLSIIMILGITQVSACSHGKGGSLDSVNQCTQYVQQKLNLSSDYPDAKNWHTYLINNNFHTVSEPSIGAVVVFQPSFSTGIDQTNGHVGIVQSVETVNDGNDWQISVRGANQRPIGTELDAGCTDVNTLPYLPYPKSRGGIEYFIR